MVNQRYARHIGIVQQLRSKSWISANSLSTRFAVSVRTIYRDIEELSAAGLPIESTAGREGGYRLRAESPVDPLIMDADDVLRLYVLGLIDNGDETITDPGKLQAGGVSAYARDTLRKLGQRIYFDTRDWYWKDEGSGHVSAIRSALLTSSALEITTRVKRSRVSEKLTVKPYGLVWKGGEWWLVAAPNRDEPHRYRLNHIERLNRTDLTFTHPGDAFDLREWWTKDLEDYGRGNTSVTLRVQAEARDEMLRLSLKPDSEVHHDADGTVRIVLHVDKWQWLVPLVASFGADVAVESPPELRQALHAHHERALALYSDTTDSRKTASYLHDDSRLRATRGRNPRSTRAPQREDLYRL